MGDGKTSLWRRSRSFRWGFFFGVLAATTLWLAIYDPWLLKTRGTVVNPVKPPEPKPGALVVDPLSRVWNFDDEKVPWEPVLPLAQISEAAYQDGPVLDATLHKWGLKTQREFSDGTMFACVASNEKIVVVAFRGTNANEIGDWIADAKISKDRVQHGQIHRGFNQSTKSLLAPIRSEVEAQGGKSKLVWVTGHSLGGAMALVFAYECLAADDIKLTGLVTFGQPLVVDKDLAGYLNRELKGKYIRFVHGGDVVPRVFPTFSHCGNLVWFVNDTFVFRRPEILAAATNEDQPEIGFSYESGPKPFDRSEFEALQEQLKPRKNRRKLFGQRREIQPAGAPAFLEDHYMTGYIHWVVTFSAKANAQSP